MRSVEASHGQVSNKPKQKLTFGEAVEQVRVDDFGRPVPTDDSETLRPSDCFRELRPGAADSKRATRPIVPIVG
jgi:hypothetical protein